MTTTGTIDFHLNGQFFPPRYSRLGCEFLATDEAGLLIDLVPFLSPNQQSEIIE